MIFKNILFLFGFVALIGCGVMSNPDDEKNFDGESTLIQDDNGHVLISRIFTDDLNQTDITQEFIDNTSGVGFEDVAYTVIDSNASLNLFTRDLNSSATQSLTKVASWINNLKEANVDFEQYNILFYTFISNLCSYKDSAAIENKTAVIKIDENGTLCNMASTINVYVYKISKDINQTIVKVVGMDDVIIELNNQ